MRKSVYVETTIPSYLTARPSRDLVTTAHQQVTREWWEERRGDFDLYVSEVVIEEAGEGDHEAAGKRLRSLEGLPILEIDDAVLELAEALIDEKALPDKARVDAVHIAVAAVNDMDILLTWNCTHLANGEILGAVSRLLWSKGYSPPVICTPDALMGE